MKAVAQKYGQDLQKKLPKEERAPTQKKQTSKNPESQPPHSNGGRANGDQQNNEDQLNREMPFSERQTLGHNIQFLNTEQLLGIVPII